MSKSKDQPAKPDPAEREAEASRASWGPPRPADEEFPDLRSLAAHHGEATLDEALRLAANKTREQHTDEGRGFATPRGTDDAVRIYGAATQFMAQAPDDLRTLVKLSPDVLRIGVGVALRAELRYAVKGDRASARRAAKKALAQSLDAETAAARALRDQFANQLYDVAGDDVTLRGLIDTALAPAAAGKTETGPGVSLASLAPIARKMLASADPGIASRREQFRLEAGFVAECEAQATDARAVTKAAGTPKGVQNLNEGEVDLYDGLNVAVLQKVVDAFATAHARDARVPRLAFVSLKAFAARGRSSARTAKKKPSSTGGAPKTGTSNGAPATTGTTSQGVA